MASKPKNNSKTGGESCVRERMLPWAIGVALLICATIGMGFYYSGDMRENRGRCPRPGSLAPLRGTAVAFTPPWHSQPSPDAVTGATPKPASFNKAVVLVSPSVVGINTSGAQGQSASGVIVHRRGFILTNHHVVDKAKDIVVTLRSDQNIRSYSARIVDTRPDIDLAIIQLKGLGKEVFQPAPLGDSDRMAIGDDVVVIGSPFGLSGSASAGIISNTQRTLTTGKKVFRDLIQTDASINPGSSGGALVNTRAEVIGINAAIYSPVEGFIGIGFAVPINKAKKAFSQFCQIVPSPLATPPGPTGPRPAPDAPAGVLPGNLRMMAKQKAGNGCWMGIAVYPVGRVVAREFDLPFRHGVLVNRVYANSPAAEAGLVRGDVLFRVAHSRIKDDKMLWSALKNKKSGDKVSIGYFRNGKLENCVVTLKPEPPNARSLIAQLPQGGGGGTGGPEGIEEISWLGIDIQPLEAGEALTEFAVSPNQDGVFVGEVEGVAALDAGIGPGDVIKRINNRKIKDIEAFKEIVKTLDISHGVLLDVVRDNRPFYVTIRPTKRDLGAWQ
ncbi:trypsin-like peptidase domain-containing protein [Verrucomicrobiota bacterium]